MRTPALEVDTFSITVSRRVRGRLARVREIDDFDGGIIDPGE